MAEGNDRSDEETRRHSVAQSADLISDPIARAEKEAKNALEQYDLGRQVIESYVNTGDRPFRLRPSLFLSLHRAALSGLSADAGNWRPSVVSIQASAHAPPPAHLVPELIEAMCDYVNIHWRDRTAVHLSAYCMWRLNWIHPFDDGNGRTSRMLSYLVLCIRSGQLLPGIETIPEQIVDNRRPYFDSLEAADEARKRDEVDVSGMERLIEGYLAKQLTSAFERATGRSLLS